MKKLVLIILSLASTGLTNMSFAAEQWTERANFGGAARHRCTGFSLGNKGYIGGGHINSGQVIEHEDYWQYDPSTDSWTQIADYGGGKRYHGTAFTIGEFAYVGLGEDDMSQYRNDFYRYSPEFNIWQQVANFPGNARRGAVGFALDGFGYVGLGQSNAGYHVNFYKYNPATNSWTGSASFIGQARSSAVSFVHNGKAYVGTGHILGNDTKDFYEYNPSNNSWTQKADVGTTDRQDATGFAVNGKGYIGTGNDVDALYNFKDFWEYNFETDTWTQFNDFSGEGRRYMVSFVINGKAYAGTGTDGTNFRDFWTFDPLLGSDEFESANVSVHPNPSTDFIQFELGTETYSLLLFDINGKLLRNETAVGDKYQLYKNEFGNGLFFYVLTDSKGKQKKGKISFI